MFFFNKVCKLKVEFAHITYNVYGIENNNSITVLAKILQGHPKQYYHYISKNNGLIYKCISFGGMKIEYDYMQNTKINNNHINFEFLSGDNCILCETSVPKEGDILSLVPGSKFELEGELKKIYGHLKRPWWMFW